MSLEKGLICVLQTSEEPRPIHAIVLMLALEDPYKPGVYCKIFCKDLPPGLHGFHVHNTGNLLDGCQTLGAHYNPGGYPHGDLNEAGRHRGDLGNLIVQSNGHCEHSLVSKRLCLVELLGRSLVIHSHRDDLGRGGDQESLETGNSGARICCGVIGYA